MLLISFHVTCEIMIYYVKISHDIGLNKEIYESKIKKSVGDKLRSLQKRPITDLSDRTHAQPSLELKALPSNTVIVYPTIYINLEIICVMKDLYI